MPPEFTYGALPDVEDEQDYIYEPADLVAAAPRFVDFDLPPSIDNRSTFAPVINQLQYPSCVGWAVAGAVERGSWLLTGKCTYLGGAFTFVEARRRWDRIQGEDYPGTTLGAGVKSAEKDGVPAWDFYPFLGDEGPKRMSRDTRRDAAKRRIDRYERINGVRSQLEIKIKHAIHKWGVVLVTMQVHTGWHDLTSDHRIPYDSHTTPIRDALHAVALGGYEGGYCFVRGSWGDEYGDNGWTKISVKDLKENSGAIWVPIMVVDSGD